MSKRTHVISGGVAEIELSVTPESLELFRNEEGEEFREEIQVSWLADGGEMERSFSVISDPDISSVSIGWIPPIDVNEEGRYVRFNFVIRDGRGGSAWVEQGVCVLP